MPVNHIPVPMQRYKVSAFCIYNQGKNNQMPIQIRSAARKKSSYPRQPAARGYFNSRNKASAADCTGTF